MAALLLARQLSLVVFVLPALSCSWSRFDDVTSDTPVAILEKPDSMSSGFGVTTAAVSQGESALLLVGGGFGRSSAASFQLGTGQSPTVDARDQEYCDRSGGACFLADAPAALERVDLLGEEHSLCFALGIGSTAVQGNGLVLRCDDRVLFSYPVPDRYLDVVDFAVAQAQPDIVSLSGDGSSEPWLLVGAPALPTAWYYPFGSVTPTELVPPGEVPPSYGRRVVAGATAGARLLAVAAPEEAELHLFRAGADGHEYIGCLGGSPGFGRALAAGAVLGDDQVPDLVVSDLESVHVFDGQTLLGLPVASSSACTMPEGALIASLACATTDDISGCPTSGFGESLAVGDLDGDGDGEIAVGASTMNVRDSEGAGAVLVWDVEQRGDGTLLEARFLSSAESGDELGQAVAMPRVGERNIIAAGAPGAGKMALFYCSSLLPPSLQGDRCK